MKRTLRVASDADLRLCQRQLVIRRPDKTELSFPIEDLGMVLLESPRTTASAALLVALGKSGCCVILCDDRHLPSSVLLPEHGRGSNLGNHFLQESMSLPLRKGLWKRIVQGKIHNQRRCLELLGIDDDGTLLDCERSVRSDDSSSREAVSAKRYFDLLIESGTRRNSDLTAALDYGYSLLRSAIAQETVLAGLLPHDGIHHHGQENPFNLADDLIEPFRPLVDYLVVTEGIFGRNLSSDQRQTLCGLFELEMEVDGLTLGVRDCMSLVTRSLCEALANGDANHLVIPGLTCRQRVVTE